MRRATPVLTAAALVAITGCGAAAATTTHPPRAVLTAATARAATTPASAATVTTTGTGTVSATPDVMTIQIGVQNTATHAAAALAANNAASAAVQAALVRQGVALADIQTSQLSLDGQETRGRVTSYQVSDVVTASIRTLSRAGTVLDDALAAAGDAGRLDGVSFSIANEDPFLAQARRQAVTAARTAAVQLAGAAGLKLVGLRSITDQTDQYGAPPQAFAASGAVAASPAPVPVQPGTQQTSVQITAVWTVTS